MKCQHSQWNFIVGSLLLDIMYLIPKNTLVFCFFFISGKLCTILLPIHITFIGRNSRTSSRLVTAENTSKGMYYSENWWIMSALKLHWSFACFPSSEIQFPQNWLLWFLCFPFYFILSFVTTIFKNIFNCWSFNNISFSFWRNLIWWFIIRI